MIAGVVGYGVVAGRRDPAVVARDVPALGMVKDVGAIRTIRIVVLVRLQLADRQAADEVDLVVGVRDL